MTEWKECKLGDVVFFSNGKSRPDTSGYIPIYGGNGILEYTDQSNNDGETIIIGRVGAYCGSVYYENRPVWVSDNALAAKPKEQYYAKYLYYLLKFSDLNQYAEGSSHPLLTQSLLNSIDIVFCDNIDEQKAIAEVLSSLDDKIDLLTRQNKTLEDIAQAYFRKWFIEEARDEWITGRLGDLCEVITKGTTPTTIKKNFVNNGINFLKVESISDSGAFLEDKFMHIDEETHNLLKRSQLKENDVLCSIAGTIGRIARVSKEILPANVNQALAIIRAKKYFRFIYYLLKSDIFQNEIHSRIVESVQANLSLSEISSIEIAIPEELINKFELFVAPIDDKVQNNKNQIRILSKLRDTLLPKLISGEIRIKM
jgi:type I restriction enzyme S subunit